MPECAHCGLFLVSPIARRTHQKSCKVRKEPDPPIKIWLATKGLAHLTPKFIEKEYTDVAVITEMGLDDEDLDYLEITDEQHRAVLQGNPPPAAAAGATDLDEVELMRQKVAALEAKVMAKVPFTLTSMPPITPKSAALLSPLPSGAI